MRGLSDRFVVALAVAVALVGCRGAEAPGAGGFRVTVRGPAVGRVVHEHRHEVQRTAIPGEGGPTLRETEHSRDVDETVEAVDGLSIRRVSIVVKHDRLAVTVPAGTPDLPSLDGRRFAVAVEGGALVVRDTAGLPADAFAQQQLGDLCRTMGNPEPFLAHAPARALREGERVGEYEEAMRTRYRRDEADAAAHVEEAQVVFLGVSPEGEGRFQMDVRIVGVQHGYALDGRIKGEFRVRPRDGLISHVEFEGSFHGLKEGVSGSLVGTEHDVIDYSYDGG